MGATFPHTVADLVAQRQQHRSGATSGNDINTTNINTKISIHIILFVSACLCVCRSVTAWGHRF